LCGPSILRLELSSGEGWVIAILRNNLKHAQTIDFCHGDDDDGDDPARVCRVRYFHRVAQMKPLSFRRRVFEDT